MPSWPAGSGFELIAAADVPDSLADEQWRSESRQRLFLEADRHVLDGPMFVSGFDQGVEFTGASLLVARIPAGTTVCVWFVHADTGSTPTLSATIDFGDPILGLSINNIGLGATSEFALDNVDYDYDSTGGPDRFTVSGSSIDIHFDDLDSGRDQIRIYVGC